MNRMRRLERLEAIHQDNYGGEDEAFLHWLPGEDLDRLSDLGERMAEAQEAAAKAKTMEAYQAESAAVFAFRRACDELKAAFLQSRPAGGAE